MEGWMVGWVGGWMDDEVYRVVVVFCFFLNVELDFISFL